MSHRDSFPSTPSEPVEQLDERTREWLAVRVLDAVLGATDATLEEDALLDGVVVALAAELSTERVELATRGEGGVRLRRWLPGGRVVAESAAPEPHLQVLQRGAPAVLGMGAAAGSEGADPGRPDAEAGPYAACVPVRVGDRVLGALLVGRGARPYGEEEVALLGVIARHVGASLERVRLFRRAATDAQRLERSVAERTSALQGAQAQLARARWLTALGQLAAGVAHDLNNALNPIIAFGELIKTHARDAEKVELYADRILLAARDGAETVRRIQRFTRRHHSVAEPEPVALAMTVREALELTRPSWAERSVGGRIEVVEAVDPSLVVLGSTGELREVLLNLITNALHAMPDGGVLRLVGATEGDEAVLGVQDTGAGMPREVMARALEPFFTTKGMRGTGLGLSEAYGIVRRHGGTLKLESWTGVGTTVLIRLPAAEAPVAVEPPPRPPATAQPPSNILLVDDNLLSLEATAAALRGRGHTVITAESAEAALRLFEVGRYHVVLTDLGLPGQSGWQLVDRLRALEPRLRIGVITGWSLQEMQDELRTRGVDLAFIKPVDPEQLLAAL